MEGSINSPRPFKEGMVVSEILNTITIDGNIFFKANIHGIKYVKLIPCYDVEYGIVISMIAPTVHMETLDKSWLKIEFSSAHDMFRFNCPAFLQKYKGLAIESYEDEFAAPGELCKIRRASGDFAGMRHLIPTCKATRHPWFSKDARLHISLAYVRKYFTESAKKEPYVQVVSSVDDTVINREIVVSVFSGKYLVKGELAFKLKRYEHELVTPPINVLLKVLKGNAFNFKYQKHVNVENITTIHIIEEIKSERCVKGTRRRVLGVRERAQRARRKRNASLGIEAKHRREKGILDFKRK